MVSFRVSFAEFSFQFQPPSPRPYCFSLYPSPRVILRYFSSFLFSFRFVFIPRCCLYPPMIFRFFSFFFLWKAIKLVEVGVLEHLFFFLEFRTFRRTPIPPSISVRNSLISLPFFLWIERRTIPPALCFMISFSRQVSRLFLPIFFSFLVSWNGGNGERSHGVVVVVVEEEEEEKEERE